VNDWWTDSVRADIPGRREARGKRYREEDRAAAAEHEADHRIERVVQRYALLVRTNQTRALHDLLVAVLPHYREDKR